MGKEEDLEAYVGLVVFGANFDAETEDCFSLFAKIKGEDL